MHLHPLRFQHNLDKSVSQQSGQAPAQFLCKTLLLHMLMHDAMSKALDQSGLQDAEAWSKLQAVMLDNMCIIVDANGCNDLASLSAIASLPF